MAWLSGYQNRKKLTLDHTKADANLPWFPVPAPMGTSVGLTAANLTEIFNEIGEDYLKIAVTKSDGTTQLYVEIECWSAADLKALPWFSKSDWSVWSDQDKEVYFYFDASAPDNTAYVGSIGSSPAQNVWDSYYEAVYHLAQDPSGGAGAIKDSTTNGHHMTAYGAMTIANLVDGLIGKALDFDGSDDYLALASALATDKKALTYETVFYPRTAGESNYGRICDNGKTDFAMGDGHGDGFLLEINGNNNFFGSPITKNAWHTATPHVNGNSYVEVDGVDTGDTGSGNVATNNLFVIGTWAGGPNRCFDGPIAEVRYSTIERSAAWRKLFHHSMTDNLVTWGVTEHGGTTAIEDVSLDLSAYYQARDDLLAALQATDGTVFEDLETFLKTLGRSSEDLGADLSAYFQGREGLSSFLKVLGQNWHDLPAALHVLGQDRQDLATYQKTIAWTGRDLVMVLAAVEPLVFEHLNMFLSATDGTVMRDIAMDLAAIKQVPQYKSVVAQRVRSVISEVS